MINKRCPAAIWFALLVFTCGPATPSRLHAQSRDVATTPAIDAALETALNGVLNSHGVKGAVVGARVIELPAGRVVYEKESARPMIPASNAKLVVMAAAIDQLGADYRFETVLALRGRDLVVVGGGDPAFGDPKLAAARGESITAVFARWADALRQTGITRVTGRLVIDDSIFDDQFVHPSWPRDQHQAWYEAPIGGLNLADNCVTVSAAPGAKGSVELSMSPGNTAMRLVNECRMGKEHRPVVHRAFGADAISVRGTITRKAALAEITVPDPGLYFAAALRTSLAARDIAIDGPIVRERVRLADGGLPADLRIIARERTPLKDVLARTGKNSLGMMAEGLIKTLGARRAGVGSWKNGGEAVRAFVESCGVSSSEISLADGSGLSRDNRLSAAAATTVLRHMFEHPGRDVLMAALAHSGVDGTMDRRLRDLPGRVLCKTGYIAGVRTLAGYAKGDNGAWYAFAFFYNNATSITPLTAAQDKACRILVQGPAAAAGNVRATTPSKKSSGKTAGAAAGKSRSRRK